MIRTAHGVVVSYETIRDWNLRFGRLFANTLKRRRPKPGDKWHRTPTWLASTADENWSITQ